MNQTEPLSPQSQQAENSQLREELQMKDQLIQQLSQELFRLVKGKTAVVPQSEGCDRYKTQIQALHEQLQGVEQQVTFYQEQIAGRDSEIYHLRQSVQELTDRSRMLEQVVQELPGVYRDKFAERMAPVKDKLAMLQRENRQLHAELQSVSYRLAVKTRRTYGNLDLPSFSPTSQHIDLPTFGNAWKGDRAVGAGNRR